jgi:hypothetical protein
MRDRAICISRKARLWESVRRQESGLSRAGPGMGIDKIVIVVLACLEDNHLRSEIVLLIKTCQRRHRLGAVGA